MSIQLKEIQKVLLTNASQGNKDFFSKMVPGTQKIYGVKTPVLNELAKKYKAGSFALAKELWEAGSQEERIIAIKILEKKGKDDPTLLLKLFQQFASTIDNWAVCDGLGMQFLRSIVKTHNKEIFAIANKYNTDKNMWKRRLSLVMVEWYTRQTEFHPAIKKLIKNLNNDDEYYVKKAIEWLNRNLKKGK
jgi:3-methyladenine DNA glycosylase AlkD